MKKKVTKADLNDPTYSLTCKIWLTEIHGAQPCVFKECWFYLGWPTLSSVGVGGAQQGRHNYECNCPGHIEPVVEFPPW